MSSWEAIVEAAGRDGSFVATSPQEFSLVFEWEGPSGKRAQRVWARRFEAFDSAMVEVRSALGPERSMDHRQALTENLELPIGAIALHGDMLVVVHKQPIEAISVDGVLFTMHRVSMVADTLEARQGGDRF